MKFLLTALILLLEVSTAEAASCPKGEHWVSSHHRGAYHRHDAVFVSALQSNWALQGKS